MKYEIKKRYIDKDSLEIDLLTKESALQALKDGEEVYALDLRDESDLWVETEKRFAELAESGDFEFFID